MISHGLPYPHNLDLARAAADQGTAIAERRRQLASLREEWEAEKMGLGDVAEIRRRLDEARLRYNQQVAAYRQAYGASMSDQLK